MDAAYREAIYQNTDAQFRALKEADRDGTLTQERFHEISAETVMWLNLLHMIHKPIVGSSPKEARPQRGTTLEA